MLAAQDGSIGDHIKQLTAMMALRDHNFVAWINTDTFVAEPEVLLLDFFHDRHTEIVMQCKATCGSTWV